MLYRRLFLPLLMRAQCAADPWPARVDYTMDAQQRVHQQEALVVAVA
jgi:hypothetical protein